MQKIKLGEILDVKRGASLSGKYYSTSGKLIRLTLGNFNYPFGGFKDNVSKDDIYFNGPISDCFILKKGDIITPLTEQVAGLLGETARIPESDKYIQSGDVGLIIPKEEVLDKSFAYYLISSPFVKKQLGIAAQQTKIRHTSPDKIKECSVLLPELSEQKRISSFIDLLTEKVDINNKSILELEKIIKITYDYWFLQYNFPNDNNKSYILNGGTIIWNNEIKRKIPIDWEIKEIGDFCKVFTGKKDVNQSLENGKYKFYSCAPGYKFSNEMLYNGKAILISGNGSYTGRTIFVDDAFDLYQRSYACVNKHEKDYIIYIYYSMLKFFLPKVTGGTHGSAIPYIVYDDISKQKILYNKKIIEKFLKIVMPLQEEIVNLTKENEAINSCKNFFLPLLLNGQIKLKEAVN